MMTEEERQIAFRKSLDPEYIEKSKKSICKDCIHNLGFNGEFYDCEKVDNSFNLELEIEYKQEGVFFTEIIKCTKYTEIILVLAPGQKVVRVN